jgi:hypothetical protein
MLEPAQIRAAPGVRKTYQKRPALRPPLSSALRQAVGREFKQHLEPVEFRSLRVIKPPELSERKHR